MTDPDDGVWEPPFIQPHRHEINKFGGRYAAREDAARIDGIDVDDLAAQYGSPLFIVSERRLRGNVRRIRQAFERRYDGPVLHGWSYKTNYTSAVCTILHQEGSWAEVVSRFEYEKARSLGVPGRKIIFNGPYKPRPILERAIAEGARLHVDHLDELTMIDAIARERGEIVPVTLRLNFNTTFTGPWTRFGFNLESGQAHEAAARVRRSRHLRLTGLHSHIGTFILEPRAYDEQIRHMCRFLAEADGDGHDGIDTIDIGGGLPSMNALQGVYLPPDQAVPDIDDYAATICTALHEELKDRRRPTLILESGRAVVDDAVSLVTSVVGTKRLPDGRRAAVLDAGINALFTAMWYHHPLKLTQPKKGDPEETVLYGPMCMNIDVVRQSVRLPPLVIGDRLVINPVGAYNNTQWLQFIEYRPPIVLVHQNGGHSVIRDGEQLADMCRHDRLPSHLAGGGADAA